MVGRFFSYVDAELHTVEAEYLIDNVVSSYTQ